ncbi:MAG: hypothetical protein A2868_02035 [Candidatus Levybacteria bacterium RIFCSPHIGHO2_01_FULL_40_15b]|nr:MAG: hypothetical protein A2868_02035 [Candidatus Levybacteria bacterium RIFCSPHIGHO2_01_FULL_40_15b]
MPKLSPVSARILIRVLEKVGFRKVHQKGSHVRMVHPDRRKTSVPFHSGENVGIGLLGKILKDSRISREEFGKLKRK